MNKHYLVSAFKSSFRGVLKIFSGFRRYHLIAFIIINIVIAGIAANNMRFSKDYYFLFRVRCYGDGFCRPASAAYVKLMRGC